MVSDLKFFRQDPMYPKKNRGAGWYYFRGNLTSDSHYPTLRGRYWSKYTEPNDGKRFSPPRPAPRGNVIEAEKMKPHKADYKTIKLSKKQGESEAEFKQRFNRIKNRRKSTRKGDEGGYRGWF